MYMIFRHGHQVNCAWTFNDTMNQWLDLGVHTEACMTLPETCSAAGGAISLWINILSCPDYGGIISSRRDESSGFRIHCVNGNTWYDFSQDFVVGAIKMTLWW